MKIELDYEMVESLNAIENKCEMTRDQIAFLCGLLKWKKPQKIVEIGVAEGGTTAIMIQCLASLGKLMEYHAVDISEKCWNDSNKETGYVVKEVYNELPETINMFWHVGNCLPNYIEEIGNGIDFVILDTVHTVPGEILDFLAIYPFLQENAVVVLHDITLCQWINSEDSICTNVLYGTIPGMKLLPQGIVDGSKYFSNLGAVQLGHNINSDIKNIFWDLTLPWRYMLDNDSLMLYSDLYEKYYGKEYKNYLIDVVNVNKKRIDEKKKLEEQNKDAVAQFHEILKQKERILLYGAGHYGHIFLEYIKNIGFKAEAFVISDSENLNSFQESEMPVYKISEIPFEKKLCCCILCMTEDKHIYVRENIQKEGVMIFPPNEYDYGRLINYLKETNILYKKGYLLKGKKE